MDTPASRLKLSRINRGFSSASKAAKHFGWTTSTYIAHENGQNDLRASLAKTYADAFGIDVNWLLFGNSDGAAKGNIIKNARIAKGWSQRELAEAVTALGYKVSQQGIDQIEKGNSLRPKCLPELQQALGLAATLHSTSAELVRQEEVKVTPSGEHDVDPLLLAAWKRLDRKSRKQLVQFALIMAGEAS